jgi:predicted ATPase
LATWQIQLLGALRASRGSAVLAQFPSRPIALLLARLALQPQRRHAREELIELLWPEVEPEVGRNRLRQALSTLRRLLEPPGVPPNSVIAADRQTIGLTPDAVSCDALEFEQLLRRGDYARALDRYRGELLPGFYDDWVDEERTRLGALYERIQARAAGGPASAPASAPAEPARSLPAYLSVFFGREAERRRVLQALREHRLVTLAGLGGFGKTRLAVEAARAAEGYGTVAFVALGECADAGRIADCIRAALRMEASHEDALAQLRAFLDEQDVLLVLDNFEQLADDGAPVVQDLLERLPRLRCLVTSRRVLNLPGEFVVALDPLPLPQAAMDAAAAAANPSLALFIDRARCARPDFALTEDNRAALIELARALEGLPLAIEIAASRVRSYAPAEMREALAERFALLTRQGPRGARHGRHASLQIAIEWSWNLLAPEQRRFFAALSVFRGSWDAAAVAAVCGGRDARAQLDALVADSLLRAEAGAVTRFSMLETLREFAAERLADEAGPLRAAHRAHFLQAARRAAQADQPVAEPDFPNLKQALAGAVEDGDPACALEIGVALGAYWEIHGTPADDLRLLRQALEDCPPLHPSRHAGLVLLAELSIGAGDSEAAERFARRALDEAGADPARRAAALVKLARVNWEREQAAGPVEAMLDEALVLAAGTPRLRADALRVKATVALKHGAPDADFEAAHALFGQVEALYRELGQMRLAHRVLLSRVGCLAGLSRYDEAGAILAQCERYFERIGSATDRIAAANMTAYLESAQQHWRQAVEAGRRCVRLAWERHAHMLLAAALWSLPPYSLIQLGEIELAARLMPFAARFWERSVGPIAADDAEAVEQVRRAAIERLGAARAEALWAQGEALTLAEAVRLALHGA